MRPERKRSLSIAGHRTSISLEAPFWEALQEIAARSPLLSPTWIPAGAN